MAGGLIAACLSSACAKPPETPSAFAPEIGHRQPLPTEPSEADPDTNGEPHREASDGPSEPLAQPTADEDALCRHIVAVVKSESKDPATAEQTAELIASCALALAHDRRRLGDEEFERRSTCMLAAETVADFTACKSEPASDDPNRPDH